MYQLDPVKNFELVHAISLPRITPDQIKEVSMDQADLHETENDYQSYPIYELREKVQD
ncbi:MAG: hypothetical protein ACXIUD_07960 [Mongoliitalea sp.]